MYFEKIKDLYNKIDIQELQSVNLKSVSSFHLTIKIAFCKCFQLNQKIHEKIFDENSFLYLSMLRGICEEVIILKFINEVVSEEDKSKLIKSIMKASTLKELKEQSSFIKKYRPTQPVLDEKLMDYFSAEEIPTILNRNDINGNRIPPTAQMADKVGLKELYNFIYRASCSFVHFNPRIMYRTVWYENDEMDKANISITNFNKYYFSFNSFYSSYLFGLLYTNFKEYLNLNKETEEVIEEIMETVRKKIHFPDLVTFEENNLQRPKTELTIINEFLENQIFEKKDYS